MEWESSFFWLCTRSAKVVDAVRLGMVHPATWDVRKGKSLSLFLSRSAPYQLQGRPPPLAKRWTCSAATASIPGITSGILLHLEKI